MPDRGAGSGSGRSWRLTLDRHVWRVVDSCFDVVHLLDASGSVLYSSSVSDDGFGFNATAIVGREFASLVHPEDRHAVEAELRSVLASPGATARFRVRRETAAGTWVDVQEQMTSLPEPGAGPAVVVMGRNVDSHLAVNVALRNLSQALNTLIAGDDAVVHAEDEGDLIRDMCRAIVEQGGYRFAWVGYMEHDDRKSFRAMGQWGASADYLQTVRVTWADDSEDIGPAGMAVNRDAVIAIDDMHSDPAYRRWRERAIAYGHRSGVAIPLHVHRAVIGVLGIYSEHRAAFDGPAVARLSMLAEHLAFGIERLRDNARLAGRLRGEIHDLHERLDEAVSERLLDQERQRIADRLRGNLEDAIFGIGERVNVVLDQSDFAPASAAPLLEARRIAAQAAKASPAPLSERHREIVSLVAEGYSNREIAATLHLSENTIKTHLQAIFNKLSVRNRAEAAVVAAKTRWPARAEPNRPRRESDAREAPPRPHD